MFCVIQNGRGFTLIYSTGCVFWWLLPFSFHSYPYWIGVCGCVSFFFSFSIPPPFFFWYVLFFQFFLRYSRSFFFNSSLGCVFSSLVDKFFLLFKTIYFFHHHWTSLVVIKKNWLLLGFFFLPSHVITSYKTKCSTWEIFLPFNCSFVYTLVSDIHKIVRLYSLSGACYL